MRRRKGWHRRTQDPEIRRRWGKGSRGEIQGWKGSKARQGGGGEGDKRGNRDNGVNGEREGGGN